jgi:ubiquinone/menaquinone biosynthesis C-methylase UbiE
LPAQCNIIASDLNQPMLNRAAARPALQGRVTFQQTDALAVPFGDRRFDLVVCQFGVMFFPDRVRGYEEAHRVLKPGGRLLRVSTETIQLSRVDRFSPNRNEAFSTHFNV